MQAALLGVVALCGPVGLQPLGGLRGLAEAFGTAFVLPSGTTVMSRSSHREGDDV